MSLKSKLGTLAVVSAVGLGAMMSSGCQSCWNDISARGGIVGTYEGDYIAISQSGGLIMDVYKLDGVYVESEASSDGWRFRDNEDNVIRLGGDVKLIRIDNGNSQLWDRYHEYHMEFESQTYREMYNPITVQLE